MKFALYLLLRESFSAACKAYVHFSVNHGGPSGATEPPNLIAAFFWSYFI